MICFRQLLAWMVIGFAFCLRADVVSVAPVADADIYEFSPDLNDGTGTSVASGALGTSASHEIRRALFRFDLTGKIPIGATINSATLQVQVVRVPTVPVNSTFDVRRVQETWAETGVTWNSRLTNAPWQTPGAEGPADSSTVASSSVFVSGLGTYVFPSTPGLAGDVQAWVNDPVSNFGWLLVSEDEVSLETARRFGTRESGAAAPVLTVDFSLAAPVIVSQPQSQTVFEGASAVFSVGATGAAPLFYQWQFNGSDLTGATNSILTLSNIGTNDAGGYTVAVSNSSGTAVSQSAILTVQPVILPPPTVRFVSPTNGERFTAGSAVPAEVEAASGNGTIREVVFRLGTNQVGVLTNPPFSLALSNIAAGNYQLSAIVTDDQGASNNAVVVFSVFNPPTVVLIDPAAGQTFPLGSNIVLQAAAAPDSGLLLTNVSFFANSLPIAAIRAPPYVFVWHPAAARDYLLQAVAVDELGQSVTSAPVAIRVFTPESVKPSVTITSSPPNFARLRIPQVRLGGTANDNVGLNRVEVQLNGGSFVAASGTHVWSAQLLLNPGLNSIRVRSADLAGNTSAVASRFFTYVLRQPLTVEMTGKGTVTPNWNGQLLELGNRYIMVAKPAAGQVFAGWTGAPSNGPRLVFIMQSNLVLTAAFVPNPFPAVQGNYAGLVLDTNAPSLEGSGLVSLEVTRLGAFTGQAVFQSHRLSFAGKFDLLGRAQVAMLRPALPPISLALSLDLTRGTGVIQGEATDGKWTSPFLALRNPFDGRTNPAPAAGSHAFSLLEADATAEFSGVAQVGTQGRVIVSGKFRDTGRFSFATTLGEDGSFPFFISRSAGAEVMTGWLRVNNGSPPMEGKVYWLAPNLVEWTVLQAAVP